VRSVNLFVCHSKRINNKSLNCPLTFDVALRHQYLALVFTMIMVGVLAFIGSAHFGSAQIGTNENGVINTDTTWAKAGSPYNLIGNVTVNQRLL
jgi:hypothetical protein